MAVVDIDLASLPDKYKHKISSYESSFGGAGAILR
jgi:hypothetical protein